MTRNLTALGLALVAIFAMSALSAASASATQSSLSWESGATTFHAEQETLANGGSQLFTITGGAVQVTCDRVTATGSLTAEPNTPLTAKTIETSTLTYNDTGAGNGNEDRCTGALGSTPIVNRTGCNYRFHATDTEAPAPNGIATVSVDIVCPAGVAGIMIEGTPICGITIPPQTGLNHVKARTVTGPSGKEHVTLEPTVSNITYHHHGFCGTGEGANGTYTGNITVKAEDNSSNPKHVTVT